MNKKILKNFILIVFIYWFLAFAFQFIAGDAIKFKQYRTNGSIGDQAAGELLKGDQLKQEFYSEFDDINQIYLYTGTYDRINTGSIKITISDDNGKEYYVKTISNEEVPNNMELILTMDDPIQDVKDEKLILEILSEDGQTGNAVTFWYSSNSKMDSGNFYMNDEQVQGGLSMSLEGKKYFITADFYWQIATVLFLLLFFYSCYILVQSKRNKKTMFFSLIHDGQKYKFLIKQLVSREFKTKYKRSTLGMFWSVLNPLLTMIIQYIVFSTIFKSDIPNFPVYLLTGIVLFSFFSEAILTCIQSIVNNASLITKVYVPKYIYPITKVFSAEINLAISLIPLILVILITSTRITKAYLLLPFGILCLTLFCLGIGLILASAMVFFRDTQFLWGVISMLWMYSTPIFYPESIIPEKFIMILKLNPLYHFIRFVRTIILEGVSPEPKAYISCMIFAIGSLMIGSWIFKKTQNKFVLYI